MAYAEKQKNQLMTSNHLVFKNKEISIFRRIRLSLASIILILAPLLVKIFLNL
jgi:hypothetical protein